MTLLTALSASYRYGGRGFALSDASLDVRPMERWAVIGPNGGGKSTLLRLLAGLIAPDSGQILCEGVPIEAMTHRDRAARLAWVPQEHPSGYPLSVRDTVALGALRFSRSWSWRSPAGDAVDAALRRTDLWRLRDRVADELSGGERRRVLLARALVQSPRVFLLDEPTSHLDPGHQRALLDILDEEARGRGCGVVAVLHDLSLALNWADGVLLLSSGRVVHSGAPDLITRDLLASAFRIPDLRLERVNGRVWVDPFRTSSQGEHV